MKLEITTILSSRTREGMVNLSVEGGACQMDIPKAREVQRMLSEAIEAAISDTMLWRFLTDRVGLSEEQAAAALQDFRVIRQGSKDTVFVQ